MEKSSCSALALAGAVNQFWWAPVWNAFAPAEVKTWSSRSKVWLFEATWLYSLAISKIIVSVAVFGFLSGRARFHRWLPRNPELLPEPCDSSSACHTFSCSTFLSHFPWTSSQQLLTGSQVEICTPGRGRAAPGLSAGGGSQEQQTLLFPGFGSIHSPAADSSDIPGHLPAAGIIPDLCWVSRNSIGNVVAPLCKWRGENLSCLGRTEWVWRGFISPALWGWTWDPVRRVLV